jgi:hypothetical protein
LNEATKKRVATRVAESMGSPGAHAREDYQPGDTEASNCSTFR